VSRLVDELERIAAEPGDRVGRARRAAERIADVGGFRWVGIYDVGDEEIAVIAWSGPGPPSHPRFPRTQGLNAAAVRSGEPVVVQDVSTDPRYLTTIGDTKSEAIFPIKTVSGEVVGTVDVESDRVHAFSDVDRTLLAAAARALVPLWPKPVKKR